jgi:hypothetical protein
MNDSFIEVFIRINKKCFRFFNTKTLHYVKRCMCRQRVFCIANQGGMMYLWKKLPNASKSRQRNGPKHILLNLNHNFFHE